jgi:hypothetical protein
LLVVADSLRADLFLFLSAKGVKHVKVLVINNDGAGFADRVELPHGTTVEELFRRQVGMQAKADSYLIRVNRQSASRDQVLVDGDRMSITPRKIEGAS